MSQRENLNPNKGEFDDNIKHIYSKTPAEQAKDLSGIDPKYLKDKPLDYIDNRSNPAGQIENRNKPIEENLNKRENSLPEKQF